MENNGSERRTAVRVPFPCKIMISSPIRLLVSHTENLSEGGLRVMLEEKLTPFTVVGIELYVDKGNPLKCKGKVAWVKDVFNPIAREVILHDTGIKFIEMNDFDKNYLKKIIDACKPKGNQE
jgi:PilZ domain